MPDTNCTIKTLNTPHNHSVFIRNGPGSLDETVEVKFKFIKTNYRIKGMSDDVCEIQKVIAPGQQEFILLEKINDEETAQVRTSFAFCKGVAIDSE